MRADVLRRQGGQVTIPPISDLNGQESAPTLTYGSLFSGIGGLDLARAQVDAINRPKADAS